MRRCCILLPPGMSGPPAMKCSSTLVEPLSKSWLLPARLSAAKFWRIGTTKSQTRLRVRSLERSCASRHRPSALLAPRIPSRFDRFSADEESRLISDTSRSVADIVVVHSISPIRSAFLHCVTSQTSVRRPSGSSGVVASCCRRTHFL